MSILLTKEEEMEGVLAQQVEAMVAGAPATAAPVVRDSGPRRLIRALLGEAIMTYRRGLMVPPSSDPNDLYNEEEWHFAVQWFHGAPVSQFAFTYQQACDYLDLNASALRDRVFKPEIVEFQMRHEGF